MSAGGNIIFFLQEKTLETHIEQSMAKMTLQGHVLARDLSSPEGLRTTVHAVVKGCTRGIL